MLLLYVSKNGRYKSLSLGRFYKVTCHLNISHKKISILKTISNSFILLLIFISLLVFCSEFR